MQVRRLWTTVVSLLVLFVPPVLSADTAPGKPGEYGKTLVAEYTLPAEQIAQFAKFKASVPDPHESKVVASLLASTKDWSGNVLKPDIHKNPYTMVVTLVGTARANGDVATLWQSGWQGDDGVQRMVPLAGLSKNGVKAGERVTMIKAASPTSFSESKDYYPVLALVSADNFEFESVKVELWSGIGESTGVTRFFSATTLLVGLIFLVLVWWFRRR